MIIYDIEIVNAISGQEDEKLPGVKYCNGWHDHANMGVSCIGAIDYYTGQTHVFLEDNFDAFRALVQNENTCPLVGFNNIPFDNAVLRTAGIADIQEASCLDLLREIWIAAGLKPTFEHPTHIGYSLDAVCQANGIGQKSGHGAMAPVWWQQGKRGRVIDYCLNDVWLTMKLFDMVIHGEPIRNPKGGPSLMLPPSVSFKKSMDAPGLY